MVEARTLNNLMARLVRFYSIQDPRLVNYLVGERVHNIFDGTDYARTGSICIIGPTCS